MPQASQVNLEVVGSSTDTGETHTGYVRVREQLSNGTGLNEADLCYRARHTIAFPSVPLELNLTDGSLVDVNGDPLVMREAVCIVIDNVENDADELHEFTIDFDFGSAAYVWKEPLIAGGNVLKFAPAADAYPTLGADGPHIIITPLAGTNAMVDIIILGRSVS